MSDETEFAQLAEDLSPEDLRIVLGVFATDVRRLTTNLSAAASLNDLTAFKRVAHGLAGAAGAVGAKALEQACRVAMVRTDTAGERLTVSAATIETLATQAMTRLEAFIAKLDAGGSERG